MSERVRRANKAHRCDDERYGCPRTIRPGQRYREHVIYPGHDIVTVDKPTRMRQCETCAATSGHPLDGEVGD